VLYYVYLFANVVPSLHPWNNTYLILVHDLFNVLFDSVSVSKCLIENFSIYVPQGYWPITFFFNASLTGLGAVVYWLLRMSLVAALPLALYGII
jgi:hypothetical protein